MSWSNSSGDSVPTSGDDTFTGTDTADSADALGGDDRLGGNGGNDTLEGGLGDDTIFGGDGDDLLTDVDLALIGGDAGNDTIIAGTGDDLLFGFTGNDSILGGDGEDTIGGEDDNDTIDGGAGDDELFGQDGDDSILGGAGNDIIAGGVGNDTVSGGAGDDIADLGEGDDLYVWQPGGGSDVIQFGDGLDTLFLPGYDNDEWTVEQNGNDFVLTNVDDPSIVVTGFNLEAITCFIAGTLILTARGEVPVETLRAGDLVVSPIAGAPLKPVRWVGHTRVDVARHRARQKVAPILVRAGALAPGVPHRDLRVSPEHALLLAGRLVPAQFLVNGTTIIQETWQRVLTYWHVELEAHGVLVAEGALAESYFDDGNRHLFDNGVVALHVDFAAARQGGRYAAEAFAPPVLCHDDPALPAILAALPALPAASRRA